MRTALLTDIHGNLAALEAVLEDAARRKADRVVTLGAHVSGPLLPAETATFMMARPWHQICGNHDRQLLSNDLENLGASDKYARQCLNTAHLGWLSDLPSSARIEEDVFLCHGSPRSDSEFLLETIEPGRVRRASSAEIDERLDGEAATVVLCGHSHLPGVERSRAGQLLVNPGSVGLPAYSDTHANSIRFAIENASPDARYALLENAGAGWKATLVSVAYDFEPMAKLADRRGRPAWSCALRTGRVQSFG